MKDEGAGRRGLGTHPRDQSLPPTTSTHTACWKRKAADRDTSRHRRGKPERRRPPRAALGARGQSRSAIAAVSFFVRGAFTLGLAHVTRSHAGPLSPAAGGRRTRRGTRCPLSVTDAKSLKLTESQIRAAPSPIYSEPATNSPLATAGR